MHRLNRQGHELAENDITIILDAGPTKLPQKVQENESWLEHIIWGKNQISEIDNFEKTRARKSLRSNSRES